MGLKLVEAGASIAMASCFNLLRLRSMPMLWFPSTPKIISSQAAKIKMNSMKSFLF